MKKVLLPISDSPMSKKALPRGASPFDRVRQGKTISKEELSESISQIYENIEEKLAAQAEKIAVRILNTYSNPINVQANLNHLLSIALETQGRFEDSLEVLQPFENEKVVEQLSLEMLVTVFIQLARAYTNTNDCPRAIALLNSALQIAEEKDYTNLLVKAHIAFACVYKEMNEYSISRNYAEKALKYAREMGDWRDLAESYRIIGGGYYRAGNPRKAIDNFQQAVTIAEKLSAPLLLGKIYTDMSAAYAVLRLPQNGIDCLKKAIPLFEKIEQKFQLPIAYNNLSVNLMLLGDLTKAGEVIKQSLTLAFELNHPNIGVILDSSGELKMLRGDYEEAEKLFDKALLSVESNKKEWFTVQILCSLARCFLAQDKIHEAIFRAKDAMKRCTRLNLHHFCNLAGLTLAECYLKKKNFREAEELLQTIEEQEQEQTSDFFILGSIARIRGLLAMAQKDEDLAIYHFNRSLSIFEMAHDLYFTALMSYKLGEILADRQTDKAIKHLTAAVELFRKLGVESYLNSAGELLKRLTTANIVKSSETSVSSQLLTLRLAEAVASRELLFRELVTILQQEGKAKKTLIAELDKEKNFSPTVIDQFTTAESLELIFKFNQAQIHNDLDNFAKEKNISVFQLRAPSAPPAVLIIYPQLSAALGDNSSLQTLLRVVELGMDVCALREKDKEHQTENESSPFTSNSLMPGFIHSSPAMTELVDEVYKIRSSDVTVLITGESGTGKELVSRAIHAVSRRKDKVFVPFNCTAVPRELTEGHLFGYKKGSFTGAVADSQGMIRAADGGTLFLDEIGDLPLDVQPKILRFLQEGEVQPLGEKTPKNVDVRIIAATNMNLEEKVAMGLFREDLYYRLNVIRLQVPPLRERRSEIPQIVNYYLNYYSVKFGRRNLVMTPQALDLLIAYDWSGNVRQLCNEVQRIVARADDDEKITTKHLSANVKPAGTLNAPASGSNVRTIGLMAGSINVQTQGGTLDEAVSALEIEMIVSAMKRNNGNVKQVAKELGLSRRGLYLKLKRYNLSDAALDKKSEFRQ